MTKAERYAEVFRHIESLIDGETEEIAILSTVVSELHNSFAHYDWTGFYRVMAPGILKVGPYQGAHGCLTIPFERGVCGKCARTASTQLVPDVSKLEYHIACSSSTRSEVVVPILDSRGLVRAVLDVDSDTLSAFDGVDVAGLEQVCERMAYIYG
jgi:L-methionine (R)-S-oxide reductase